MRAYDIIIKKRNNIELSDEEIKWIVDNYVDGEIPDYQISALLMAIYFNGLNERETLSLTMNMAHSGDMIDLSKINGIKVDKHSTGGVGDKTTLIVAPIVASFGVPVAKMSGRGLGFTGGTIDKLESINGFKTEMDAEDFMATINQVGICVIGQTGDIAPADKKLYSLRDVTGTVESIPLIASSIMSKKLAAGADAIVLDVTKGSGAFMKTVDNAIELAQTMVKIGEGAGKKTIALITDMDRPLGYAIGNSIEVIEAIETLKGNGPEDLTKVCVELAGNMLFLAEKGSITQCKIMAEDAIKNGSALAKFRDMVRTQGGDEKCIDNYNVFKRAETIYSVKSTKTGYITHMNTEKCGMSSVVLGAGRETKNSQIDYSAGIILKKKVGDYVKSGEEIAVLHTNKEKNVLEAETIFLDAITISENNVEEEPLVYARVSKDGVEIYN
ncbi:MAG: pyrimidine-nucleoside phosphorylase [Oscillospiraceae bacterium]